MWLGGEAINNITNILSRVHQQLSVNGGLEERPVKHSNYHHHPDYSVSYWGIYDGMSVSVITEYNAAITW